MEEAIHNSCVAPARHNAEHLSSDNGRGGISYVLPNAHARSFTWRVQRSVESHKRGIVALMARIQCQKSYAKLGERSTFLGRSTSLGGRSTSVGGRSTSLGGRLTFIGSRSTFVGRSTFIGSRSTFIGSRSTFLGRSTFIGGRPWEGLANAKIVSTAPSSILRARSLPSSCCLPSATRAACTCLLRMRSSSQPRRGIRANDIHRPT